MLNKEVLEYIDRSVLCWLATTSSDYQANVSPKEIFGNDGNDHLYIANIASPQSQKNIIDQPKVCVSFIDILEQKGFKIYGHAAIIQKESEHFERLKALITSKTQGQYPFKSIFRIEVESIKTILAPSYIFYPDKTKETMIQEARKQYGL